jgi:halocyanin-like protein
MTRSPSRRRVLQVATLACLGGAAGCLASSERPAAGASDPDTATATGTGTGTATPAATPTDTPTDSPTPTATTTPVESIDDWLATANGYRGDLEAHAPDEEAHVEVGRPTEDHSPSFQPAGLAVAPGTTVEWRWEGDDAYNVVALDGSFDSGEAVEGHGTNFAHTFEATGEHAYVSEPGADDGFRGAVVVREPPRSGYPEADEWLRGIEGYEGEVTDRTDADEVTVRVGTEGYRGAFGFDPLLVKLSPGTTVRFEWTGEGGPHNVAFRDVDVESPEFPTESGVHLEHAFEEPGVYRYACEPHRAIGQRGALVVE